MGWFRVVFKLVRSFEDKLPEPYKVASQLKTNIDRFKETLPLFQCLCNPGLFFNCLLIKIYNF